MANKRRSVRLTLCPDQAKCLKGNHTRLECRNLRLQAHTRLPKKVAA